MHFSLGEERMAGIVESVETRGYFPCHKTTGSRHDAEIDAGGWDKVDSITKLMIVAKEQECFGARNWKRTGDWLEAGIDPEA